jgi:hypothetical protein
MCGALFLVMTVIMAAAVSVRGLPPPDPVAGPETRSDERGSWSRPTRAAREATVQPETE